MQQLYRITLPSKELRREKTRAVQSTVNKEQMLQNITYRKRKLK